MKEITIRVPDNCELKQDGNTYIIVEKEKKLTYEDVARELFFDKNGFYINTTGNILASEFDDDETCSEGNHCISRKQAEKLLAINKLMNVAKYLNDDWKPDWSNDCEDKYYLSVVNGHIRSYFVGTVQCSDVYFKSEELAKQAIEILGEETIKLALCTDY